MTSDPGSAPKASVIIPTYKDWDTLQLCLDALARQDVAPESFEIIVGNNNGSAQVPGHLRLPANARVIHVAKPGSYAARNGAVAVARGEILFFTDSDCQPKPDWISQGLALMKGEGLGQRFAGAIELFPAGAEWTAFELYDRITWLHQEKYVSRGWGATANLIVAREVFARVGPFDESAFSGGDKEWNMRAQAAGVAISYQPQMVIRHPARASMAEISKKRRRTLGGKFDRESPLMQVWPLPPVRTLLPSIKKSKKILRNKEFTRMQAWGLVWITYQIQLITFHEMLRLRTLRRKSRRA